MRLGIMPLEIDEAMPRSLSRKLGMPSVKRPCLVSTARQVRPRTSRM